EAACLHALMGSQTSPSSLSVKVLTRHKQLVSLPTCRPIGAKSPAHLVRGISARAWYSYLCWDWSSCRAASNGGWQEPRPCWFCCRSDGISHWFPTCFTTTSPCTTSLGQ